MGDAAGLRPRTVDVLLAQSEDLIEGVFPRRHAAGHYDHSLLPSAWSRRRLGGTPKIRDILRGVGGLRQSTDASLEGVRKFLREFCASSPLSDRSSARSFRWHWPSVEQSAQPTRGVINGSGRVRNVGRAGKTDHPIAKVLAHDKNEDNEHDDDRGRSERKERVDRPAQDVQ